MGRRIFYCIEIGLFEEKTCIFLLTGELSLNFLTLAYGEGQTVFLSPLKPRPT